jgi:hypothetical protein
VASPAGVDRGGTQGGDGEGSAAAANAGPFVCGFDISIADLSLYVLLEGLTDQTIAYCPGVDARELLSTLPMLTVGACTS